MFTPFCVTLPGRDEGRLQAPPLVCEPDAAERLFWGSAHCHMASVVVVMEAAHPEAAQPQRLRYNKKEPISDGGKIEALYDQIV